MKPLVVALIFGFLAIPAWARLQTIVVTGKIMCKANPVVSTPVPTTGNVTANPTNNDFHGLVELYDYDSFDPDDLLDKRLVNNNDEFTVFGEENEFFSITPYVLIFHTCNVKQENFKYCYNTYRIYIPTDNIDKTYVHNFDLTNETVEKVVCKDLGKMFYK